MYDRLKILAVCILVIIIALQIICPVDAIAAWDISEKPLELYKAIQGESGIIAIFIAICGFIITVFGFLLYLITKSFGHQVMFFGIAIVVCSAVIYYVLNSLGPRLLNAI